MKGPFLLDTCAALWLSRGELGETALGRLRAAAADGLPTYLSPITAWEVGQLVARGRYALAIDPLAWFDGLIEEGLTSVPLTPDTLVASSFLPQAQGLRDPADRILAATARLKEWTLVTRDRPLLDYAAAGHITAISC